MTESNVLYTQAANPNAGAVPQETNVATHARAGDGADYNCGNILQHIIIQRTIMLFLFDSRVTYLKPTPQYRRPTVTPVKIVDDDDDLFLATWYMFLSHVYRKDNK